MLFRSALLYRDVEKEVLHHILHKWKSACVMYTKRTHSLSSSLVTKVFQDDKGFVWISTLNGLNKYDGTRTVQYNKKPGDPNSLRSNYINVINQDKNGYLIIGMIDGLQRYDYARDRFDSIPMLLENGDEFPAYIASILNSSDGKTYIGTSGHGIFIVEEIGRASCRERVSSPV